MPRTDGTKQCSHKLLVYKLDFCKILPGKLLLPKLEVPQNTVGKVTAEQGRLE
jgi:hypothetical protein